MQLIPRHPGDRLEVCAMAAEVGLCCRGLPTAAMAAAVIIGASRIFGTKATRWAPVASVP